MYRTGWQRSPPPALTRAAHAGTARTPPWTDAPTMPEYVPTEPITIGGPADAQPAAGAGPGAGVDAGAGARPRPGAAPLDRVGVAAAVRPAVAGPADGRG